jgi:hypothetical protein
MPDVINTRSVESMLSRLAQIAKPVTHKALDRCARLAQREAISNAPRSPTMAQKKALRKTKRKVTRKATAHSRAMPGGLEKSISMKVGLNNASVFIAANSQAGRYGARMHDGKGKSWRNRGAGTIAKGSRADDKFIERAIRGNEGNFLTIINDEMTKALGKV